ncbi:MAG: hypothetical protein ACO1OT_04460 [Heyndrickxia sp.]
MIIKTIRGAKQIIKTSASKIVIGNTSFPCCDMITRQETENGATALPAYVAIFILS